MCLFPPCVLDPGTENLGELIHATGVGSLHAAVLRLPVVVGVLAYPMLPADILDGTAASTCLSTPKICVSVNLDLLIFELI